LLAYIYSRREESKKSLWLLIDPDDCVGNEDWKPTLYTAEQLGVECVLVGGSLLNESDFNQFVAEVKKIVAIPVVIFPGNYLQLSKHADGILMLALISSRNPEFLIGQHVIAAPLIKRLKLEVIPTGYMLVGANNYTSVGYMSNSQPIPSDKPDIASATALAGEMLGLKLIYLEAGSGAKYPVEANMISAVRKTTKVPIVVGGGIQDRKAMREAFVAGADIVVVGNGISKSPQLLHELAEEVELLNSELHVHQ